MANTSVTRAAELAQKKVKRVFAARFDKEFYAAAGLTQAAGTKNLLLAHLPEHAVITAAYVIVHEASNAATTATVAIGTAEAGAQVLAAVDVKVAGVAGELVGMIDTGTGLPLFAQVIFTGATTNFGDYTVVVEYTEYTKNSGEYTRFEV